jgi:poly(A) polymerase
MDVHVLFGARDFIEVATFRSGKVQTAKNGVVVRDNHYGKLENDVVRRDFNIIFMRLLKQVLE